MSCELVPLIRLLPLVAATFPPRGEGFGVRDAFPQTGEGGELASRMRV